MRANICALVCLSFAITLAAEAQQCGPGDSPLTCWRKFVPDLATPQGQKAVTDTAAAATQAATAAANTGISNLVSPSGSALKDFLSLLSASLESSSLTDSGNALTFDANVPTFLAGDAHKIKLQFVFADPKLDPQIVTALGTNAAAITALNDQLASTDDMTGSFSYNVATTSLGRSIAPHRDFFDALVSVAFPDTASLDRRRLQVLVDNPQITDESKLFSTITDPVKQAAAINAYEASARAVRDGLKSMDAARKAFATLLNNQPQAFASGLYHYRNELIGADEYSFKATFEAASGNLRAFYKDHENCTPAAFDKMAAADRTAAAATCLIELRDFAAPFQAANAGRRLSFSVEHKMTDSRTVSRPDLSLNVTSADSSSTIATLVLGYVPVVREDDRNGRVDLSASYENVSGDPAKDNRFVASVTYTQKINDSLSIPLSLIFANREQFLSNVDEKLNAHFGIVYKLPTGK